jgi:hypothetical protein
MIKKFPFKRNKQPKENKKVKNAQVTTYDGINFKSKLEVFCYKKLKEHSIPFEYEKHKFTLFEGFKPTFQCYFPNKLGKLELDLTKLRSTTYTPDFVGDYWIVETKGRNNEVYPVKLKLFRELIEKDSRYKNYKLFIEPHNQNQILQAIELIKQYK